MSDSNSLPSSPLAEQQTIDTISPTAPTETVPEEFFDSNDRPDVQQYFASSTDRFQRPRKAMRKSTKQDLPPSPSTVATDAKTTTARETSTSSRAGNEDDNAVVSQPLVPSQNHSGYDNIATSELLSSSYAGRVNGDSTQCKKRPRSDVITKPAEMSVDEPTDALATVKVRNQWLNESIKSLEAKSARDDEEIEQLKSQLKLARTAKSAVASDLEKARANLEDMQGPYKKLVSENEKLDRLNKNLMRQILQTKLSKRDCELLNATQANQMQELREEVFRKTNTIKQLDEKWTKLAKDRVAAAQETEKLANSENSEELQNNISALATDLEAARIQIQEQQAELEATRIRMVQFEQQQISLEDECFQYDGAETTSPSFGSPALSQIGPERRMAESQLLQEARLSDTPALTDDFSTRSTASLASHPPVASPHPIDSAGPSDSPNSSQEVKSSSDPPKRSASWQHENVYQWPSERERRPYMIVGPRPRDVRDLTEEVEVEAVSRNDSGTQTSELRKDAPPKTTSCAGTQASAPPVAAASVATPVAARAGPPLWHHVALGASILLFLVSHAVFVQRRMRGGANELSSRVVVSVSMRDGWWGSPWVERMGRTLDFYCHRCDSRFARLFAGAGSWGFLAVTPIYCAELAPPDLRGLMVGMNGVNIALGYGLASYMGLAFYYVGYGDTQWRAPLGIALIWPVMMILVICISSSSCYFFVSHLILNNYGITIYAFLSFDTEYQLIFRCGWISVGIIFNLVGALIMDKTGRGPFLMIGVGGCCISLILEAAMVASFGEAGTNKAGLRMGVAAAYLFLAVYSVGVDVAGVGIALSIAVIALTDLVYLQATATAFANIGWKFYLLFIVIPGLGTGFVWWFLPETKNIPLEEMGKLFGDGDDIAVYADDIHVDRNTHELVIGEHGATDRMYRVATEAGVPENRVTHDKGVSHEVESAGSSV